jgi:hypothetical protein
MIMQGLTRISIAVVCALGVTAANAQTVQPRGQGTTQVRPPLQTAQAPGGAASGATTAGATAAVGTTTAGTVAFIGMGAVAVTAAASESGSTTTVTHNP